MATKGKIEKGVLIYSSQQHTPPVKGLVFDIRSNGDGGEVAQTIINRKKVTVCRIPTTFRGWVIK